MNKNYNLDFSEIPEKDLKINQDFYDLLQFELNNILKNDNNDSINYFNDNSICNKYNLDEKNIIQTKKNIIQTKKNITESDIKKTESDKKNEVVNKIINNDIYDSVKKNKENNKDNKENNKDNKENNKDNKDKKNNKNKKDKENKKNNKNKKDKENKKDIKYKNNDKLKKKSNDDFLKYKKIKLDNKDIIFIKDFINYIDAN